MVGWSGLEAQRLVIAVDVEALEEGVVDYGDEGVAVVVGDVCGEGAVARTRDDGIEGRRQRAGVGRGGGGGSMGRFAVGLRRRRARGNARAF